MKVIKPDRGKCIILNGIPVGTTFYCADDKVNRYLFMRVWTNSKTYAKDLIAVVNLQSGQTYNFRMNTEIRVVEAEVHLV